MAHGMGVLWICGDLEASSAAGAPRVAMGTVSGETVWGAHPASRRATIPGPQPTPTFIRYIDEASSDAMEDLLQR
jgi:hypothetical protein